MKDSDPISEDFLRKNMQSGRPQIMGVYFLFYKKELIYIGTSKDIHIRLKQHKKFSFFKYDYYAIYPVTRFSDEDSTGIERACIRKYKPKYNVMCNPDFESGKNKVWFTFVAQWKSYRKVSEECGLPIAMCERVIQGLRQHDSENDILTIENTVLNREMKMPVGIRKEDRLDYA